MADKPAQPNLAEIEAQLREAGHGDYLDKMARRFGIPPQAYIVFVVVQHVNGDRAAHAFALAFRRRMKRHRKRYQPRRRPPATFTRARWILSRLTLSRQFGSRPWAVVFRVAYFRPTHWGRINMDGIDPPERFVYGFGGEGIRTAKRVARAIAADPSVLGRLPADHVGYFGADGPYPSWWVGSDDDATTAGRVDPVSKAGGDHG